MRAGASRFRLFRGHVDRIGEYPKRPAAKSRKAGLRKKKFGPITAGTGDGLIDGPGLLLVNFPPVTKNLDQREARSSRRRNLKPRGYGQVKCVARAGGAVGIRNAKRKSVG